LRITNVFTEKGRLLADIGGNMSGEVIVQTVPAASITIDGKARHCTHNLSTGTVTIPFENKGVARIAIDE